jgi:hypothetical protein
VVKIATTNVSQTITTGRVEQQERREYIEWEKMEEWGLRPIRVGS